MIYLRDIECPWCQTHDDIEIEAIILFHDDSPRAELEFVCSTCRRSFGEEDIKRK